MSYAPLRDDEMEGPELSVFDSKVAAPRATSANTTSLGGAAAFIAKNLRGELQSVVNGPDDDFDFKPVPGQKLIMPVEFKADPLLASLLLAPYIKDIVQGRRPVVVASPAGSPGGSFVNGDEDDEDVPMDVSPSGGGRGGGGGGPGGPGGGGGGGGGSGPLVPYFTPRAVVPLVSDDGYFPVSELLWSGPTARMKEAFVHRDLDQRRINTKDGFGERCITYILHLPEWDRFKRLKSTSALPYKLGPGGVPTQERADPPPLHLEHVEALVAETLIQILKAWLIGDPWDPLLLVEVMMGVLRETGAGQALLYHNSQYSRVPYTGERADFTNSEGVNNLFVIVNMLIPISGAYDHALESTSGDQNAQQAVHDCMFAFIDAVFCRIEGSAGNQLDEKQSGARRAFQNSNIANSFDKTKNHVIQHYFKAKSYETYRLDRLNKWTTPRFNVATIDDDSLATFIFFHEMFQETGRGAPIALYATAIWAIQRAALVVRQIVTPNKPRPWFVKYMGPFSIDEVGAGEAKEVRNNRRAAMWTALSTSHGLRDRSDEKIDEDVRDREQQARLKFRLVNGFVVYNQSRLDDRQKYLQAYNSIIESVQRTPRSTFGTGSERGAQALHRLLANVHVRSKK